MAKRKTDAELRTQISLHSQTARELLGKSHEIHMQALNAESTTGLTQTMMRVIELQRTAINETKKVTHLEKVLLRRQSKEISKQTAELKAK